MAEGPRFRSRRAPDRGAPWSLIGVLALVGLALLARAWWPLPGAPAPLVEVRGDVPSPGTYAVTDPTIRSAVQAAGLDGASFPSTPVPHGHRVVVRGTHATIERPSDPVLVGLPVDPNTAERHELIALPGVGEATADRILEDRAARGPYRSVADLRRVLRADTLDAIEPFLAIAEVPPVDLNTAPAGELETLPGIGPVLAARIVVNRAEAGPYGSVDDLRRVEGVGDALLDQLRPLVRVGP